MSVAIKMKAQFIIFRAGKEEFGLPIEAVREIINTNIVTPIPNSPNFINGIINVRGEIVTAINVRSLFSLQDDKITAPKHMIVAKRDERSFGFIVDQVVEILRTENNIIQKLTTFTQVHEKYVSGIISYENRLIILLDLEKLLIYIELLKLNYFNKRQINTLLKQEEVDEHEKASNS